MDPVSTQRKPEILQSLVGNYEKHGKRCAEVQLRKYPMQNRILNIGIDSANSGLCRESALDTFIPLISYCCARDCRPSGPSYVP